MKIGILGSTRGTSCKYLIDESINGNINCKVEVIISNNKDAEIFDKARIGNIDFVYLSNQNYNDKLLKILKCYNLDIIFLVGYMKIIPKSILDIYSGKIYNIHPSLLPKYKNMKDMNIHELIINNNETITGCTLHIVTEKVDEGNIILQKQLNIDTNDPNILKDKVQKLESELLVEFINIMHKI